MENDELIEHGLEPDAGVLNDDPTAAPDPQKVHSWTRINTFQTCPFLYKGIYLDGRKGEVNPLMVVGRVVHEAIGLYNNHCIKHKLEHAHDKAKAFVWQALENSNLPGEFYADVFDLMQSYIDTHTVSLESVVGAEERIAIDRNGNQVEWDDPDVWFRAILDYVQIEGHIAKITDYKTGWAMVSDPFQLEIYAWMIKKVYPQVTDIQIELDYIRHEYQKLYVLTDEQMEHIDQKIMSKVRQIEKATEFEPQVGIQCTYCPLWYCCPAMKEQDIPYKMPRTVQDAAQIAATYERLTRLASEVKKVLKNFCDVHGTVEVGGRTYQFRPTIRYDFAEINDLLVALDKHGINLLEYVNVDYRKAKALFVKPEIEAIFKRLGQKSISVTFTSTKTPAKTPANAGE